jgi:hypothetical protein
VGRLEAKRRALDEIAAGQCAADEKRKQDKRLRAAGFGGFSSRGSDPVIVPRGNAGRHPPGPVWRCVQLETMSRNLKTAFTRRDPVGDTSDLQSSSNGALFRRKLTGMGTVRIKKSVQTAKFAVMLDDTWFGPQRDHECLAAAVSGTLGAKLGELWTEAHSELSSRDEYLLEITANNAAALWKTGFSWEPTALGSAFKTFHEKIALRAFELYQERGCIQGVDLQDWLQAEQEVLPIMGLTPADIVRHRRINIVEEHLKGQTDVDRSIYIPFEGIIHRRITRIPEGELWPQRFSGELDTWQDMPYLRKGNVFLLWVEERCEWVGIEYEKRGHHFEGDLWGVEEDIYTDGPFQLNDDCARLILGVYGEPEIPFDRVLMTSPVELKAAFLKKFCAE